MSASAEEVSIAEVTSKVFDLLNSLEAENRRRVVTAVLTLLGESAIAQAPLPGAGQGRSANLPPIQLGDLSAARTYFDSKEPTNKIEELAVAARFAEQYLQRETHAKEDLEETVKAARRNFDSKNFARDIANAKTKGLFNKGKELTLAYYGQQYVDALPDRNALDSIRAPKGAGRRKAASKKVASPKK